MRLKSFYAPSMIEAMQQVRDALGDDAIIVTTREGEDGYTRITAAVEQMPERLPEQDDRSSDGDDDGDALLRFFEQEDEDAQTDQVMPAEEDNSSLQKDIDALPWQPSPLFSDEAEIEDYLTDIMLKHNVPAMVSEKIISAGLSAMATSPQEALVLAVEECFSFSPLPLGQGELPIALVGAPGVGKTLAVAKLAARARMSGLNIAVISTDTVRAGGVEQLNSFLKIMDVPLQRAGDQKSLKKLLSDLSDMDQVLIDTGGVNPFDPYELRDLARLLRVADMNSVLVMPAGGDAEECAEMAMTFNVLGIDKILPTRLDFSRRIGGVLSAADRVGLSFTDGSHTHQVAEGLVSLDAEKISRLLTSGSLAKS